MSIKKFSDYTNIVEKTNIEEPKVEETVEPKVKETVEPKVKETVEPTVEETVEPKVELLEEKIIKFNNGSISSIMELIKNDFSEIDYFIRKINNDIHIVKYNESLNINLNEFVNSIFNYYSKNENTKNIINGIKVKGNSNFAIIENLKITDKFINDLTTLLTKKK